MSRTLVLVRHAKAADGAPDISRVLAPRGEREAPAIGSWLASQDIHVDHAIVSPSARTRQTWQLAASTIGEPPATIAVDDRIYDNNVRSLLAVVHEAPEQARTLALVGHNPSMQELAVILDDGTGDANARVAMASEFPTSAVIVYAVEEWADVAPRTCRLVAFAICRD